ncbi:hypothetical protein [Rhodanobacter lindaniclasticus]
MLLFGLPLFSWYGLRRTVPGGDPWLPLPRSALSLALLVSAVFGVLLTGIDVVFKTTEIMGMSITELDRASLGWYHSDRRWPSRTGTDCTADRADSLSRLAVVSRRALLLLASGDRACRMRITHTHVDRPRRRRRRRAWRTASGRRHCPPARGRWLDRRHRDLSR